jgi:hypothetical protein
MAEPRKGPVGSPVVLNLVPAHDVGRKKRRTLERHPDGTPMKLSELPVDHPDFPHGGSGYAYGCRCVVCKTIYNSYQARYRRMRGWTNPETLYVAPENRVKKFPSYYCAVVTKCDHSECHQLVRDYQREYQRKYRKTHHRIRS